MKQIKIVLGIVLSLIVSLSYADEGKILYQPDFKKTGLEGIEQCAFGLFNKGGTRQTPIHDGKWSINNEGSIVNKNGGIIVMGSHEWENYIFSVTYQAIETKAVYPWPGIIVRHIDNDNFIYLCISPKEHYWRLWSCSNGVVHILKGAGNFPVEVGRKYKVSLECKGDLLSFYFDGKHIATVNAPKGTILPDHGKIGLFGASETTMAFSDILVRKLEGGLKKEIVATVTFDKNVSISGHEANKEVKSIPGSRAEMTANGQSIKLTYNFRTKGHDACMISKDIDIGKCNGLSIMIKGADHQVFFVLTDSSGENHYIGRRFVKFSDWRTFNINFSPYLKSPFPGVVDGNHWGGDGNQRIDFPIKKIMVGINDCPDTFIGKGEIELGKITFYKDASISDVSVTE